MVCRVVFRRDVTKSGGKPGSERGRVFSCPDELKTDFRAMPRQQRNFRDRRRPARGLPSTPAEIEWSVERLSDYQIDLTIANPTGSYSLSGIPPIRAFASNQLPISATLVGTVLTLIYANPLAVPEDVEVPQWCPGLTSFYGGRLSPGIKATGAGAPPTFGWSASVGGSNTIIVQAADSGLQLWGGYQGFVRDNIAEAPNNVVRSSNFQLELTFDTPITYGEPLSYSPGDNGWFDSNGRQAVAQAVNVT